MTTAAWPPIDGLRDRTQLWIESLMENRRLDPDYNPQEDIEDRLARIVAKSVRGVQIEYNDGGGNSVWKWILGILASLVVSGVVGGVLMYGKLSSLEAKTDSIQSQVNEVKKIVEPRYRGSP